MKYHLISDPLCELDEEIPDYENCEECPNFYDCMEVEEEMDTYKEIKARLDDLSSDELQALAEAAIATIESRKQSYKRKKWEDITRAIEKYVKECGDIEIIKTGFGGNTLRADCLDDPGILYANV